MVEGVASCWLEGIDVRTLEAIRDHWRSKLCRYWRFSVIVQNFECTIYYYSYYYLYDKYIDLAFPLICVVLGCSTYFPSLVVTVPVSLFAYSNYLVPSEWTGLTRTI